MVFRALPLLCVLGATACIDFAEPQIPNRQTPAVVQANVRVFDTGTMQIDGSVSPGRDSLGFTRPVLGPFIGVNNVIAFPLSVNEQGVRSYNSQFPIARNDTRGPYDISLPEVADVGALPAVRWFGVQKLDPDTIRPLRGADIVLTMDTAAAQSNPANRFRQWFLDIRAGVRVFRLSGDGPLPLRLRIPSEFVPPATDDRAAISLIYFQSSQLVSPGGGYIASVVLDTRLNWTVVFLPPP
jgi:hypothetical protein